MRLLFLARETPTITAPSLRNLVTTGAACNLVPLIPTASNKFFWLVLFQFFQQARFFDQASVSKQSVSPAVLDDHPSFSCQENDSMSIDQMQVSSTQDTDLECHYGMPDGSTCKEYHSCQSGGSVIQNTQCGGATSVTFKPGQNAPPGCSIGVHSVGFNCGPASSTVPSYSTPTPPSYESTSTSIVETTSTPVTAQSTSGVVSTAESTPSVFRTGRVDLFCRVGGSRPAACGVCSLLHALRLRRRTVHQMFLSRQPAPASRLRQYPLNRLRCTALCLTASVPYSNASTPAVPSSSTPAPIPSSTEVRPCVHFSGTCAIQLRINPSLQFIGTRRHLHPRKSARKAPPRHQCRTPPLRSTAQPLAQPLLALAVVPTVLCHRTVIVTQTIAVSTTVCPVTETAASVSVSSPALVSSTEVSPVTSSPATSSTIVSPVSSASVPAYPTPTAPGLLSPNGLNTLDVRDWLQGQHRFQLLLQRRTIRERRYGLYWFLVELPTARPAMQHLTLWAFALLTFRRTQLSLLLARRPPLDHHRHRREYHPSPRRCLLRRLSPDIRRRRSL